MKTNREAAIHNAVRTVLERVPALRADPRTQSLRSAAAQLAKKGVPGARLIARATDPVLDITRSEVLRDTFNAEKRTHAAAPASQTPKAARPTALVSGGSMTGMLTAALLAKSGQNVVIVEPRPQHIRDVRFSLRQGMIDTVALVDPTLAKELAEHAARSQFAKLVDVENGTARKSPYDRPDRPDPENAPDTGQELVDSGQFGVLIARELESLIEKYVRKTFPDQIQFVEGKLHPAKQPDGNVIWQVEKPAASKDAPPVYEDLLKGIKPSLVVVAEGAHSSTRDALGIATAPTTQPQFWTGGVIHKRDDKVRHAGLSSTRFLIDEKPTTDAKGSPTTLQSGLGLSDGHKGLWTTVQMPPGYGPDTKWSQEQINDYYFQRAALVWQTSEEKLRAAGASGPFATPGSQPTPFVLQGKAAKEAARVLPDGTVVALMGDAVQSSTSLGAAGMNIAISEVMPVLTLMESLQSGVSPKKAAASYQEQIFEHGGAWSADGVQWFYPRMSETKEQKLINAELRAIADWRKRGGASPLERLEKILAKVHIAAPPIGLEPAR
jgi:2-polyprenyl-6-methoxyphenol hydroxylase-like FAD-dependent oxidoreductase